MNRVLMVGLIVIVSAALVGGFMVVGGPGYARLEKHDMARARDLQGLHGFLLCRNDDKVLPKTLESEGYCPNFSRQITLTDPVSGDPYIYRRLDDTSFEVCATFATNAQMGKGGFPSGALKFDGQIGCRTGVKLVKQANFTPMDQFIVEPIR